MSASQASSLPQDSCATTYLNNLAKKAYRRALTTDPMAYGVKGSRKVLETITQYVHEQGLTARRVGLEELFAPPCLDL